MKKDCRNCIRFTEYDDPCVIDKMSEEPIKYPDKKETCYLYQHNHDNRKEIGLYENIENDIKNIKNNIDNYVTDKYDNLNKKIMDDIEKHATSDSEMNNKLHDWCKKQNKKFTDSVDKILKGENPMYFNIGDIVLFCWKPGYSFWRKGKIVANNFAMCNLPDFIGKAEYYISEIDENGDVIDTKKSVAIDVDSKYIIKFEHGMEWCIGKKSNVTPCVRDFEQELKEEIENMKKTMRPYDMVLVKFAGDWHIDFFEYYINETKESIKTMCGRVIMDYEDWTPYITDDDDKQYRELMNVDSEYVSVTERDIDIDEHMYGNWCELPEDDYARGDCPQIVQHQTPGSTYRSSTEINLEEAHKNFENAIDEYKDQIAKSDRERWKNQFSKTTFNDFAQIPAFQEVLNNEKQWREKIEKLLDDINQKLILLMQGTKITKYPYPFEPGTLQNPWYGPDPDMWRWDPDRWKIYCDKNKYKEYDIHTWNDTTYIPNSITTTTKNTECIYTSNVTPGDPNYISIYKNNMNTTDMFDYKKYNDMCSRGPQESTMFGNEIIEDTKIHKNNNNNNE